MQHSLPVLREHGCEQLARRCHILYASNQQRGEGGPMANITSLAKEFFEACETGKGWEGCRTYCLPNAPFSAQSEPLAEIRTLQAYTEWMKGPRFSCQTGGTNLNLSPSTNCRYGEAPDVCKPLRTLAPLPDRSESRRAELR
jgi:hypothetical protein